MTPLRRYAVLAVSKSAPTARCRYVSRSGFCIADSKKSLVGTFWTGTGSGVSAAVKDGRAEQKIEEGGISEILQRTTPCSQSSGAQRAFAA